MKLTERLQCIASKVPKGSKIADIGTDHAYIPVYLIKNDIAKSAIAADINKGPLERASIFVRKNNLENQIETRLGSGLTILSPNEADTIIIAGMGGMLICDILAASQGVLETAKTLILQPMIAQDVLREWLYVNEFKIVDEQLAQEGDKIYNIIVAEHGYESVDKIYYDIGKKLFDKKDPLLGEYLKKKIDEVKKILEKLEGQDTQNALDKKAEYEEKLEQYKGLITTLTP